MRELGVELNNKPEDREEGFHDALRDGIALCQLVNTIRPDSVEEVSCLFLAAIFYWQQLTMLCYVYRILLSAIYTQQLTSFIYCSLQIKTDRDSTSAEDNILHFLQACNGLGVQKVSQNVHSSMEFAHSLNDIINCLSYFYFVIFATTNCCF